MRRKPNGWIAQLTGRLIGTMPSALSEWTLDDEGDLIQ